MVSAKSAASEGLPRLQANGLAAKTEGGEISVMANVREQIGREVRPVLPARTFASKIRHLPNGCWLWLGHRNHHPRYPQFSYGICWDPVARKLKYAHRYAYEFFHGAIPKGLECDHTCRTPLCVNPNHIELVTHAENIRRRGPTRFKGDRKLSSPASFKPGGESCSSYENKLAGGNSELAAPNTPFASSATSSGAIKNSPKSSVASTSGISCSGSKRSLLDIADVRRVPTKSCAA